MDARLRELERVEDGVLVPWEGMLRRGTNACGAELEGGTRWDWTCTEAGFARHCS
jgi:hypothetical protein